MHVYTHVTMMSKKAVVVTLSQVKPPVTDVH